MTGAPARAGVTGGGRTRAGVTEHEEELMASNRKVGNLLALAVLSYLSQQPMHPYQLGRSLRENGDARSIKFNHGSLYMVVGQLAKAGFISARETNREGQRPERTVYALTAAGRAELRDWLRELIGTSLASGVPELFLIEEEYRLILLDAEAAFVGGLVQPSARSPSTSPRC